MTIHLTARQRICVYLVIAGLVALACGGVSYTIDANAMNGQMTRYRGDSIQTLSDCELAALSCKGYSFVDGKCMVTGCSDPPDKPATPVTNCPFGKTNNGVAWTADACQARAQLAGCYQVTLYSFGCYGYRCSKLQCGP